MGNFFLILHVFNFSNVLCFWFVVVFSFAVRNPNVDNDEHNLWRPVHGNIIHYANITNTGIEPEVSPHEENIGFWDAFFLKHQDTLKVDTGNLSVDEVFLITGHI